MASLNNVLNNSPDRLKPLYIFGAYNQLREMSDSHGVNRDVFDPIETGAPETQQGRSRR